MHTYRITIRNYFTDLPLGAWGGISANFINSILSSVFYFLSIYFVNMLHFSVATAGSILAFYSLGTMLGGWIGGQLTDRYSFRLAAAVGLVLEGVGYGILSFLKNPYWLGITAFLLGCASYIFTTANYTMVLYYYRHYEHKKMKSLGLLAIISNFGLSTSAILIGHCAHYGFQYIFFTASGMLLLLAITTYLQNPSSVIKEQSQKSIEKTPIKHQKPLLITALICVFLGGSIVVQYSSTYPIYIHQTFSTMGLQGISYLFALNCILVVILQTPIIHLIRYQNKFLMIGVGSCLQGLSLIMLNFYTHYSYSLIAIFIYTIGEVIFFPSVQFVCHEVSSKGKKGRGIGIYRTVYGASRAFGASAGSFIYTSFHFSTLWNMAGIFGVICLCICFYWKKYWK